MLVLQRKVDERIVIRIGGHKIVIVVTQIQPHAVKIGVKAPPMVSINREEIDEQIQQQLAEQQYWSRQR